MLQKNMLLVPLIFACFGLAACTVSSEDDGPGGEQSPTEEVTPEADESASDSSQSFEVQVPRTRESESNSDTTFYLGDLSLDEDGCVRLDVQDKPVIVWPSSGFDIEQVDGSAAVIDQSTDDTIARIGEEVVVDGRAMDADLDVNRDRFERAIAEPFPEACADKDRYFLMGDQMSRAPGPETLATPEPPVIDTGERTVYFPRQEPSGDRHFDSQAVGGTLALDGNGCLRLNKDGPVIVWPYAGFTVDTVDGEVAVVDEGSEEVIASVGEQIALQGSGIGDDPPASTPTHIPGNLLWHDLPEACGDAGWYFHTGPGIRPFSE